MPEPMHDLTIRSTATSKSEGRLKDNFLSRKKKKKLVRKIVKRKKYGDNY